VGNRWCLEMVEGLKVVHGFRWCSSRVSKGDGDGSWTAWEGRPCPVNMVGVVIGVRECPFHDRWLEGG
jgi:hypothetical protein